MDALRRFADPDRSRPDPAGVGVLPTLEALGLIAGHLFATPMIGRRRRRWGASPSEVAAQLPGDELIPTPRWSFTHGITIHAPARQVWPWIAQIGQGRGGFYSYQTLENLAGCQIHNVAEIHPEWQHPQVGQEIKLHPESAAMQIALVRPPWALVLHGAPYQSEQRDQPDQPDQQSQPAQAAFATSTWQFALYEPEDGTTRFLMRGRSDYSDELMNRLFFGPFPMEPIQHVMSRRMMKEIKRLAERHAERESPAPAASRGAGHVTISP